MVTATERTMGRRQINRLIDDDGVMIVLRRRPKLDTPGGGWRWGVERELDPQKVALIPFKRRMTYFMVNTELGDVADLPYVFLGRHNLDVEPDDRFTYQGNEYKIKTVDFKTEIRVTGQVDYYAAP